MGTCQSALNKSNNKNKPKKITRPDGTVWIVKEIPRSNKKVVKKQKQPLKKMSNVLLIDGFARESMKSESSIDIKIEQRILLFLDYNTLNEEQMSDYMNKMDKILRKHHDEGGIDVITKIMNDFVWLGNDADSQNVKRLTQLKITHVLNCAGLDIRNDYPQNIKQHIINAEDEHDFDIITSFLDESFEFIDECRREKSRILIHCMMGMNRSATILIAYLMYNHDMNLLKATEYVIIRRGWILKNMAFRRQLIQYANKIDRLG
mmetsp:Transcript_9083/g.8170  ORF Transcript_9083/g.8170 Transcript_9083/m.8170 type:complete len:262 (+) Transcript_9083:31-816(+)